MHKFKRVAVAISGGVDSAVSALLLKRQGFDVCGIFMKNWDEVDEKGHCNVEEDFKYAQLVCQSLDIEMVQANFVKEYWNKVFREFLDDYENGLTPNPDILCNSRIKFDELFKFSKNKLDVDALATGHYARSSFGSYLENYCPVSDVKLLTAADTFKDQTFFLSNVPQEALRRTMFPIGNYKKYEIKEIAKKSGLEILANKKESTGICFIGKRNFKSFISEYIHSKPGYFIDIDNGNIISKHDGIHQWTIGQRCRITGCLKPYFTVKKDIRTNNIFIASGTDHPSLFTKTVFTSKPFWIRKHNFHFPLQCKFRFQHTKPLVSCEIEYQSCGLKIELEKPLRAITPGQYAVLYLNNECLGNARIIGEHTLDKDLNFVNIVENKS